MDLSHRLKVRPIGEGKVKIFKLINSGRKDPNVTDSATKLPITAYNAGATFAGYFVIYDKYEAVPSKKKKILKNVIGSSIVVKDGKDVLDEVIGDIEFNKQGLCVVKPEDYNKLVCLTRANENGSNPYRNKSIPAVWEEVDAVTEQENILNKMDLEWDAENYAMSCDPKEAIATAAALNLKYKKDDVRELRMVLRGHARSFPKEFFRNTKNKEMKLKLSISDAMKLNIIDLTEGQDWIWLETDGTDRVLATVEAGKDPYEVLIAYLNINKEDNKRLNNELDKIMHQPIEA